MTDNTRALQDAHMRSISSREVAAAFWQAIKNRLPFLRKGGAAIADQGLFAGSNFLVNVLLARFMLPVEYGAFATGYALFLLMGSLHIAVLIEPMLVFGSGKYGERWPRYLGMLIFGHWVLSILLTLPLIAVAYVFQQQGASIMAQAMLGLCIAQPFILLSWMLRRAFYVISRPQVAASGGFLYLLLMLGGTLLTFHLGILSPFFALFVVMVASLITSVWFLAWLKPVLLRQPDDDASLRHVLMDHVHYGKWSAPTMILTWIPSNIYYTVLPLIVGLAGSGVLKASMNLIMPILHANTAISVLLAPTFVRALKYQGKEKLQQRTHLSLGLFVVTSGIYMIILVLYGNQLIDWIYDGQYNEVLAPGILLIMGFIPLTNGIGEIISGSLRAIGKLDYIFWTHVVSGAFTLTVSMGLLYLWGISGAYPGLLLASTVAAVVAYLFNRHGLRTLKADRISELHSFDTTEAAVSASMRADLVVKSSLILNSQPPDPSTLNTRRLNILIVDYDLSPDATDSPLPMLIKMAETHHIRVIAGLAQRDPWRLYTGDNAVPDRLQCIFYDLPGAGLLKTISPALHNWLWQAGLVLLVHHLNKKHSFDVVHHLTRQHYTKPNLLPLFMNRVPVVTGPLYGGTGIPQRLRRELSYRQRFNDTLRRIQDYVACMNPLVWLAWQRTARIYTSDATTADCIQQKTRTKNVQVMPVRSLPKIYCQPPAHDSISPDLSTVRPFRIVSNNPLDGTSGTSLVLQAFKQVLESQPTAEFWIYGTGVERSQLQRLTDHLEIEHRVWFKGRGTSDEWIRCLNACHAVLNFQLYGSINAYVLQAIAAGRPVIGLQSGENKTLLSSDNHILLRPVSSDALIAGLRDTLLTMASEDSSHQASSVSHKTAQHSQQLLPWDEIAARYLTDYVAILRSMPRPNLSSGSLSIAGGD